MKASTIFRRAAALVANKAYHQDASEHYCACTAIHHVMNGPDEYNSESRTITEYLRELHQAPFSQYLSWFGYPSISNVTGRSERVLALLFAALAAKDEEENEGK